jgi:hypothetical protein
MNREYILKSCRKIQVAFKSGELGQTEMPEESNPGFKPVEIEERLAYFTLPMALNYQRNSYDLWKAAAKTYNDKDTKDVFNLMDAAAMPEKILRGKLLRYKLALQPNKHIHTWQTIAETIDQEWGSIDGLLKASDNDYLSLREFVQRSCKKGFPYLSGPKIFNYWCYILTQYCNVQLKNAEYIEIAPDTHITKCSVKLGVITEEEAGALTKEQVSERWRQILKGSGIKPIDMHAPLWFWSRNGFIYEL